VPHLLKGVTIMDYMQLLFGGEQTAEQKAENAAYLAEQQRIETQRIESIKESKAQREKTLRCSRCYGSGFVSQFRHVQGGRCFACN
jgi:hypothetical protein